MLGGLYGEITSMFTQTPFAVPSDDYGSIFFARPNRSAGYSDQFASGDSAVAPVQKEILTALYAEYFRTTRKLSHAEAISLVFNGGDERLTIRNYGDDNSLSGNEDELNSVIKLLAEYLTVEVETPPKFLGFVWYPKLGWRLPVDSYLTKTYLNERRPYSNFRKYPNLGWVEKRKIFTRLGHPDVAKDIFPEEDARLKDLGLPWTQIAWRGENERIQIVSEPGKLNPSWILGKDYQLTAQEKLATGEFIGLEPKETAPMIKLLLDKSLFNVTRLA
jgi:hypothetical protein